MWTSYQQLPTQMKSEQMTANSSLADTMVRIGYGEETVIAATKRVVEEAKLTASKYDDNKPELSLVSFESIAGEAKAMEYGANKYSRNNYKGGMEWTRLLDASLRHITKYSGKEDLDEESGLNHLYHAKACLGMLIYYIERGLGKDDR